MNLCNPHSLAAALVVALPGVAAAPAVPGPAVPGPARPEAAAEAGLAALEARSGGRLGVFAIDTASGARIGHRAGERFPLCSTFKAILAGAVLHRSQRQPGFLEQRIRFGRQDLVSHSPIAEQHLEGGLTVEEMAAATVQTSDNTAANQLMARLGGPAGLTAFARSIGNRTFRLDRWETALNSAIPGDPRDTDTPAGMGTSLQALVLGTALGPPQRQRLQDWLIGTTTGDRRVRAGVPSGWQVGDKTGTCGAYGTANDVAVLWPPDRAPIVLAVFHTQADPAAAAQDGVIAEAATIVAGAFRPAGR
ncbi:class A beta-lactamase [Aphanothece minutissima]|uniref:Beta-lactamase n=1 Tax=Aphanothece cf. minutissima CCALA 015 TaxID=2107695 RepID=A0ABX5FAW3_9CHRO|nr:class A beta-lactamase [Aphanothece minutissima]PSB38971.1 class A beta-lactamase [Aphanothece cf. minutissima CCALA 015]